MTKNQLSDLSSLVIDRIIVSRVDGSLQSPLTWVRNELLSHGSLSVSGDRRYLS